VAAVFTIGPPSGEVQVGGGAPILIAGPCVIEDDAGGARALDVARLVAGHTRAAGVPLVFKASFDKANRTRLASYRGPGLARGLAILADVRAALGVPVLTDVHEPDQADAVAAVVDVLQVPAFLCRQSDLVTAVARAAAEHGRAVNLKKGQFLAPQDMAHVVEKARAGGATHLMVTERGTTFGYADLVVDMRSLVRLRDTGAAVIFDATHSVQRPGLGAGVTGGDRELAPVLARAAAAVGVDGLFAEVHPDPDRALSDGPNALTPALLARLLADLVRIRDAFALSSTTAPVVAPAPSAAPTVPEPGDLLARAARVRLLVCDVDGVLTDGRLYYGPADEPSLAFHIRDGSGFVRLRKAGLQIALLSGRRNAIAERRAARLGVDHVITGEVQKLPALERLLTTCGLTAGDVAYVGDDILDLPVLRRVGLAVAVADAAPEVRRAAHLVTQRPGGRGAVREVCDLLLRARGLTPEQVEWPDGPPAGD
jgi:2-dehydro-3-deoxyphosphooctonate aldolase (KDO 8-P synthase)